MKESQGVDKVDTLPSKVSKKLSFDGDINFL